MNHQIKIYISGKYQKIEDVKKMKSHLQDKFQDKFIVVSNWENHKDFHTLSKEQQQIQAKEDISNLDKADVFIMLYQGIEGSEMFLELGYTLSRLYEGRLKCILVLNTTDDEYISQFFALNEIQIVDKYEELLAKLHNIES